MLMRVTAGRPFDLRELLQFDPWLALDSVVLADTVAHLCCEGSNHLLRCSRNFGKYPPSQGA